VASSGGELLRAARKQAGLSPEALAFKAGVSVKTLERLEGPGDVTPRRATARMIAHVLGTTPGALGWPEADLEPAA
jgi:transcriptional regulator with XRE-family HTH domain